MADKSTKGTQTATADTAGDAKAKAEKRSKFISLINKRVSKVNTALANIATMANAHNYTFEQTDVDKVRKAITAKLDDTLSRFVDAINGKAPAKAGAEFDITK